MNVLINIYGEITKDIQILYKLNETEFKVAKAMLNQIESIQEIINSENGIITLYFEKSKYWCEVEGYSKEKAEEISNSLNGAVVFEFGEFINSIFYYNHRVMLYIVCQMYIEVFYDPNENAIRKIQVLEENHPRLALYSNNVDISDLNV